MSGCGAFPQQHAALWQRLPDYFWPPMGWWRANGSGRPSWAAGIANGPGIEGSREPAPQMAETEGGWAVVACQRVRTAFLGRGDRQWARPCPKSKAPLTFGRLARRFGGPPPGPRSPKSKACLTFGAGGRK